MISRETGGRFAPTAIRMRVARRSSPYPQRKDFAKYIGISASRLSNIENGLPLGSEVMDLVLKKMPWLSADWLRYNRQDGLSGAVLQRLAPLIEEESDTTLPRSRSRSSTR